MAKQEHSNYGYVLEYHYIKVGFQTIRHVPSTCITPAVHTTNQVCSYLPGTYSIYYSYKEFFEEKTNLKMIFLWPINLLWLLSLLIYIPKKQKVKENALNKQESLMNCN